MNIISIADAKARLSAYIKESEEKGREIQGSHLLGQGRRHERHRGRLGEVRRAPQQRPRLPGEAQSPVEGKIRFHLE